MIDPLTRLVTMRTNAMKVLLKPPKNTMFDSCMIFPTEVYSPKRQESMPRKVTMSIFTSESFPVSKPAQDQLHKKSKEAL